MEYNDFLDYWANNNIYPRIPADAEIWEEDVLEILRAQWATVWKKQLGKLDANEARSDAAKGMVEAVQLDVFGMKGETFHGHPVDNQEADVSRFIPSRETETAEQVHEAMYVCALHAAYKFARWETRTQLAALLELHEDIPASEEQDYQTSFSILMQTVFNALTVLRHDIEVKPNFGRLPTTARLYKDLNGLGERLWTILEASALKRKMERIEEEEETETEEEGWRSGEPDEWTPDADDE